MKFITVVPIAVLGLIFVTTTYAKKSPVVQCSSFSSCYHIKQALLPKGGLQDYPQYATYDSPYQGSGIAVKPRHSRVVLAHHGRKVAVRKDRYGRRVVIREDRHGRRTVVREDRHGRRVVVRASRHERRMVATGGRHRHYSRSTDSARAYRASSSGSTFRGRRRSFPSRIKAPGRRVFIFSPRRRAWAAYSPAGQLVGYGRASGGANWCRRLGRPCRTPRGTFRISRKGSVGCRSGKYPRPRGGAPMPYCMFFMRAYAIHGSPDVPDHNASHGCIRVKKPAAAWLHRNFIRIGTKVVVTSY